MNIILKSGALLIAALLVSPGLGPTQALAQTAKNVKCKGCVNKKDIGKNAVKSKQIKDGAIKPSDLSSTAKPAGADYAETSSDTPLNPAATDIVIHTVTVTAPGPGTVIASASLFAYYNSVAGEFICGLERGTTIGGVHTRNAGSNDYESISYTRAFPVEAAGNVAINLICYEISGDIDVSNPVLAAWFVPGKY
jgi:hypothetical protein